MTQIATVTGLPGPGTALVAVVRQSACAHDCAECGGCGGRPGSLTVRAETELPVSIGDKVELYSSGKVLGIAALVYLLPAALFLLGYLLPAFLPEGGRYLCGGLGFLLGLAGAVWYDRRDRRCGAVSYQIIRKL